MDMEDLKAWAGRAAGPIGGPPMTPDEGASMAPLPEEPAADPHESSASLRSLGEATKTLAADLKGLQEKIAERLPDLDLGKVEKLVDAIEDGSDELFAAAAEAEEMEDEAEEERKKEEEEAAEEEDDEEEEELPGT